MKYTYFGFSQARLVELGLDLVDTALLRWFVDFKETGKMRRIIVEDRPFYWVSYQAVIDSNPILNISNKDVLARRFKKLVDAGLLFSSVVNEGKRLAFFAIREEGFAPLVEAPYSGNPPDSKVGRPAKHPTQKSGGKGSHPTRKSGARRFHPTQKSDNSSFMNSSIKRNSSTRGRVDAEAFLGDLLRRPIGGLRSVTV